MTDKQIMDCEYLLKVGEMRTCKALNVSFYRDIICNQGDCIILELKQQLKAKEQECDELKQTLTEIKEIAEIEIECKTYEIENDCFNETRCKALNEHIDFIKQILQKINECEEKYEN